MIKTKTKNQAKNKTKDLLFCVQLTSLLCCTSK